MASSPKPEVQASLKGILSADRKSKFHRSENAQPDRQVSFGPIDFADEDATPDPEKSSKLLHRKATGKFKHDKPNVPSLNLNTVPSKVPEPDATPRSPGPRVSVESVHQEIKPHLSGPVYTSEAVFKRTTDESLGLVIVSTSDSNSGAIAGARIGDVLPSSPARHCSIGNVAIDDRVVAVNGESVKRLTHEEVVAMVASVPTGEVRLTLERSTVFKPSLPVSPALLAHGTGSLPSKKKQKSFSKRSLRKNERGWSQRKPSRSDSFSIARSVEVVLHRHPNSNGLQIGVRGGLEEETFPRILTATHPRSPFAPLTEGGEVGNNYELIEIDGEPVLGKSLHEIIETLKIVGECVKLRVIPPSSSSKPRRLDSLFKSAATDSDTEIYLIKVRRAMYSRMIAVTTEPAPEQDPSADVSTGESGLQHISESAFADLAARDLLFEWVLNDAGHFFGLPKSPKMRSEPGNLAASLDSLYPPPIVKELPREPSYRLASSNGSNSSASSQLIGTGSPPLENDVFDDANEEVEAGKDVDANDEVEAGKDVDANDEVEAGKDDDANDEVEAGKAVDANEDVETGTDAVTALVDSVRQMQLATKTVKENVEGLRVLSPSGALELKTAADALRSLQAEFDEVVRGNNSEPTGISEEISKFAQPRPGGKFIFNSQSPSLKKRQLVSTPTRGHGSPVSPTSQATASKRQRSGGVHATADNATPAIEDSPATLEAALDIIQRRSRAIQAATDVPGVMQQCLGIESVLTVARRLLTTQIDIRKPALSSSGPVGVVDIDEGSDSERSVPASEAKNSTGRSLMI